MSETPWPFPDIIVRGVGTFTPPPKPPEESVVEVTDTGEEQQDETVT
jgi:hypothetical protein